MKLKEKLKTHIALLLYKLFPSPLKLEAKTQITICDDCAFHNDLSKKLCTRIEDDNLYFCKEHWENYQDVSNSYGANVEDFNPFHVVDPR